MHLDADRLLEVLQAASAAQRERAVQMAGDEDALDHRLQEQVALDGLVGLEGGHLGPEALERPADVREA